MQDLFFEQPAFPYISVDGTSMSWSLDDIKNISKGTVISVWTTTEGLPEQIRVHVKEKGCLCLTLPETWTGDFSRLGEGLLSVDNEIHHDDRSCSSYMAVGDGQIEFDCWRLTHLECLHTQLPLLFLRDTGWKLVAYPWDPRNIFGLQGQQACSGPNFKYNDDVHQQFAEAWREERANPSWLTPTRPVDYYVHVELQETWEYIDFSKIDV